MQEIISNIYNLVEVEKFGGKAHWLSWLKREGYNVPYAIFISVANEISSTLELQNLISNEQFKSELNCFLNRKNEYSVAIRSSGTLEDAKEKSLAGHFDTYLGSFSFDELLQKIAKVAYSHTDEAAASNRIGVIIQSLINPSFSGVVFSSNPLNGYKTETIISVISGFGDKLVSGQQAGTDIVAISNNDGVTFSNYSLPISETHLRELYNIGKKIEQKLSFPVDIEWCIDKETDQLFILQCRPLTGYQFEHFGIIRISLENKLKIPNLVLNSDKINLRLLAEANNITISQANLVVLSSLKDKILIDLSQVGQDENCESYSVVLLHPNNIEGNIIRHFAKKEVEKQKSIFRPCHRYKVRQYADLTDLEAIIKSVANQCFEYSWNFVAIIQEIFEPEYTGIAKKISDGYLVELARGHFVPKGIVNTSQYILDNDLSISFKNEVLQKVSYKITDGQALEEEINEEIKVDNSIIIQIIHSLFPILKDQDKAVEFGVLKQKNQSYLPYLIDLVEDKSKLELRTNLILEGVISPGLAFGSLLSIGNDEISKGSLHLHYHNEIQARALIDEQIIFYCQSPDIALLSLLETYNNSKIGFIFKEGSTLSHFAIILRERGIPAIVTNAEIDFKHGDYIDLDALNSGFLPSERLKLKAMKYVFPYINPDTDGVCATLSYSFLNNDFTPVIFGNFDNETMFVLNSLEIDYPKQVNKISNNSKIALVDTHHIAQLPQINFDNVIEVIDHHPAGDSDKLPNAKIQNEEVGSVCTLITERIIERGIIPTRKIAGLLSFAIISNTLNFTAPSSTQRDEKALEWLSNYIIISEESILGMFKARSDISEFETYDLLLSNNKVFEIENKKISIIQLELAELETLISRTDFKEAILKVQSKKQSDYCLFSGVDIIKRQSVVIVPREIEKELIRNAMNIDFINDIAIVNRILLRKTDFVPSIQKYLAKFNA